jgi:hypothetical protein
VIPVGAHWTISVPVSKLATTPSQASLLSLPCLAQPDNRTGFRASPAVKVFAGSMNGVSVDTKAKHFTAWRTLLNNKRPIANTRRFLIAAGQMAGSDRQGCVISSCSHELIAWLQQGEGNWGPTYLIGPVGPDTRAG